MAGAKKKEQRYVCTACGGNYFAPINDRCPGCRGAVELRDVTVDESGVVHVETD